MCPRTGRSFYNVARCQVVLQLFALSFQCGRLAAAVTLQMKPCSCLRHDRAYQYGPYDWAVTCRCGHYCWSAAMHQLAAMVSTPCTEWQFLGDTTDKPPVTSATQVGDQCYASFCAHSTPSTARCCAGCTLKCMLHAQVDYCVTYSMIMLTHESCSEVFPATVAPRKRHVSQQSEALRA
jgi:hypothetical protein